MTASVAGGRQLDVGAVFERITAGADLTREQARWTFEAIMGGQWPESLVGAVLGALRTKGECVDELVGAAAAMRTAAVRIRCATDCIDTCGTGGDGISTFNVSTAAAIIAAGAGATVAKHGNRSTTRKSGSTEVLRALGIDVDAPPGVVERCLAEARIGYLNARNLHPAMRYAAPVRRAIPGRTIFNLLGPLTNPAGARRQVVGVPDVRLMEKVARALGELGAVHVWVVHGGGLCDLTVTGETRVIEQRGNELTSFTVSPEDAALCRAELNELLVRSPDQSARVIGDILAGRPGACRDHALLNAGAALVVAGLAENLREGVARAAASVDDGRAMQTLRDWRALAGSDERSTAITEPAP